ncbi:MAG TPA: hypothetical protein PKY27_13775 [Arachnia sp.]|jgi:hypothetical protein|nr:hypothetical protein [Propionibacteriaceae bacterium]HOA27932.1 hypothetical protein [Arachnia sp.]HQD23317.1 hypothetical protein [Arachnia sp.]
MNNLWLALEGAWHVLLAGIILGAGLPAIFALGLRSLSYGTGKDADDPLHQPHLIGKIGAVVCFSLVIGAIGLGIAVIVAHGFGVKLSFERFIPGF